MARTIATAAVGAVSLTLGVIVFAVRCDHAELGDGPLPFADVMVAGLVLLVVPWMVWCVIVLRRAPTTSVPTGIVSVGFGFATAIGQPGNLFAVYWVAILAGAFGASLATVWRQQKIVRQD